VYAWAAQVSLLDMLDGIVGLTSTAHVAHAGGVHAPLSLFGAGGSSSGGGGGAGKGDTDGIDAVRM
jgi:hypothetical protein